MRVILVGLFVPVFGDKNILSLVQGGNLSHGTFYGLFLDGKGDVRETFLHLLFLKCLQLKIIDNAKQHILEWHQVIAGLRNVMFFS